MEPRKHLGAYSRGYIPHIDAAGLCQHITFHLADSLPSAALVRMATELVEIPEPERDRARRIHIQNLLDAGHGGCLLRRPECAAIVADSLRFGDGSRYRLHAWVVMPNHCHVLIDQIEGWPLGQVVQGWKRHTARHMGLLPGLDAPPPIWQREYFDRFIRNERHFTAAREYIEQNPVTAGLVSAPEAWPWGSAAQGSPSCTRRGG